MSTRNYEIVEEHRIKFDGHTLHRIRALVDYPNGHAKKGDIGGFVESIDNLRDWAWIDNNAKVYENAIIYDNALIRNSAEVYEHARVVGNASIVNHAVVKGFAYISGNVVVEEHAIVKGDANISDNVHIGWKAIIGDSARLRENVTVGGRAFVGGRVDCRGWVKIQGDSTILGGVTLIGDVIVDGETTINSIGSPMHIKGSAYFMGANIKNQRDYIVFENVGTEKGTLTAFKTDSGVINVTRGCFFGPIEDFTKLSREKHDDIIYNEYQQLLSIAVARLSD